MYVTPNSSISEIQGNWEVYYVQGGWPIRDISGDVILDETEFEGIKGMLKK
jgi:hypothetical protein